MQLLGQLGFAVSGTKACLDTESAATECAPGAVGTFSIHLLVLASITPSTGPPGWPRVAARGRVVFVGAGIVPDLVHAADFLDDTDHLLGLPVPDNGRRRHLGVFLS